MSKILSAFKHKLAVFVAFISQYRKWRKACHNIKTVNGNSGKIVIIPCDPWSVGGSRGDEAMLMAVIQYYKHIDNSVSIGIVSDVHKGEGYVNALCIDNLYSLPVWSGCNPAENIYNAVVNEKPETVIILGADCMDGFYSPSLSLTLLSLHDLFSRTHGITSKLMGFSFNDKPYKPLCYAFKNIFRGAILNLRDEVSLNRFMAKTGQHAGLVADIAFMLQPDSDFDGYRHIEKWITARRDSGTRYIIGMNFHPMLRKYGNHEDVRHDALLVAGNIRKILDKNPSTDFIFIPHDDRDLYTDNLVLKTMADFLSGQGVRERIYYSPVVYRASQLKAICNLLDGLVSSRMHLAIAAFGQGKSVLSASYQGKFDGLFKHFHMSCAYLLTPQQFISDEFVPIFQKFINDLPSLNKQVAIRLPEVIELSEKNLI